VHINYAAKLVQPRRALSSAVINSRQEPVSGQACNPPAPKRPSLILLWRKCIAWYKNETLRNTGSGFYCLAFLFVPHLSSRAKQDTSDTLPFREDLHCLWQQLKHVSIKSICSCSSSELNNSHSLVLLEIKGGVGDCVCVCACMCVCVCVCVW